MILEIKFNIVLQLNVSLVNLGCAHTNTAILITTNFLNKSNGNVYL